MEHASHETTLDTLSELSVGMRRWRQKRFTLGQLGGQSEERGMEAERDDGGMTVSCHVPLVRSFSLLSEPVRNSGVPLPSRG